MNKYQHEGGRGCLGKTIGILAIVGITMFSIGSAFANPVDDFIDAQRNFTLGMYVAQQNFVNQVWPTKSAISVYHTDNIEIANNNADTNSIAYNAGVIQGVLLDAKALSSIKP